MIAHTLAVESFASHCLDSGTSLLPFSSVLNMAFRTLHVAHFYLRTIPRLDVFAKNRDKMSYLGGAILNITVGDLFWVKKGAHFVLVAKSALTLGRQAQKVKQSYFRLGECFQGTYPLPTNYLMLKEGEKRSASLLPYLPRPLFELTVRIENIAKELLKVAKELFRLSLDLMELSEALIYDRMTETINITGLAISGIEEYKHLKENARELASTLEESQRTIDRMLTFFKANFAAKDIIELVKKAEPHAEKAEKVLAKAAHLTQDMLHCAGHIALGRAHKRLVPIPTELVPRFRVRSFDDSYSPSEPSRKARKWEPNGRYYSDD